MKRKLLFGKEIRRRLAVSILAGMLAAVLTVPGRKGIDAAEAWWGVLYPQFCYPAEAGEDALEKESPRPVKIKFRWLHGF